jgi:hypothetical protein
MTLVVLLALSVPALAQNVKPSGAGPRGGVSTSTTTTTTGGAFAGVTVNCPNGFTIKNGIEVIVNMRSGFSYTATAIGVGSFDPIIAVTDGSSTLCSDDTPAASSFEVSLPTSGKIGPSNLSAQMPFTYRGSGLGNISFIVGSAVNGAGSFVLLIEGLAVTSNDGRGDGAGDPFVLSLTENLINSGVDASAYMISVTDALDPTIYVVDSNNRMIILNDGTPAVCDDAGTPTCFGGQRSPLTGSYVMRTNGRRLPGGQYDSLFSVTTSGFTAGNILEYRFTSNQQRTFGDYVAAFHLGTTVGR